MPATRRTPRHRGTIEPADFFAASAYHVQTLRDKALAIAVLKNAANDAGRAQCAPSVAGCYGALLRQPCLQDFAGGGGIEHGRARGRTHALFAQARLGRL